MSVGILVAGVGNLFLGDDGFGPEVVRRLAAGPVPSGVRVVDYGIRGMHLAYDLLDGYDAIVLVDAMPSAGIRAEPPVRAGELRVLEIGADSTGALGEGGFDAHGMDPVAVLASLGALGGDLPPRTLVVGAQPADVTEGIGLSPPLRDAVDGAVAVVRELVEELLRPGAETATTVDTANTADTCRAS